MGYIQIYIYNLCMRYHGWLPNSTPVEGCGKRKPWVSTCFNHSKVVQDFARIHSYPQFISQNSGLVASRLEQQWLLYSDPALTCSVFLGIIPSGKRLTKITTISMGKSMASRTWTQWPDLGPLPGLHRRPTSEHNGVEPPWFLSEKVGK